MTSQMAMITTILPIAFGLFSLQFPAGLVLYFLVSNLWRLGQQEIIMRKITRPGQAGDRAATSKDDAIDVPRRRPSACPRRTGDLREALPAPAGCQRRQRGDGYERVCHPEGRSAGRQGQAARGWNPEGSTGPGGWGRRAPRGGRRAADSSSSRRRNNKKRKRR